MGRYARNSIGQYAPVGAAADDLPGGATPTGKKTIDTTAEVDVASYATAQVVDENLTAANIKKDVEVLGITGEYEGSGGGGTPVDLVFPFSANVTFNVSGLGSGQASEFSPYGGINATGFGLAAYEEGYGYSVLEELIFDNQNTDYVMFAVDDDFGYLPYDPTAWSVTVSGSAEILDGGESTYTKAVHITGDCVINAVRTP